MYVLIYEFNSRYLLKTINGKIIIYLLVLESELKYVELTEL